MNHWFRRMLECYLCNFTCRTWDGMLHHLSKVHRDECPSAHRRIGRNWP